MCWCYSAENGVWHLMFCAGLWIYPCPCPVIRNYDMLIILRSSIKSDPVARWPNNLAYENSPAVQDMVTPNRHIIPNGEECHFCICKVSASSLFQTVPHPHHILMWVLLSWNTKYFDEGISNRRYIWTTSQRSTVLLLDYHCIPKDWNRSKILRYRLKWPWTIWGWWGKHGSICFCCRNLPRDMLNLRF